MGSGRHVNYVKKIQLKKIYDFEYKNRRETTYHVDLGNGAEQDDGENGYGKSESKRMRHVPPEPAETGSQEHHEKNGRPNERS